MQFSNSIVALAAALSTAQGAALLGFNYGATKSDGYTAMLEADFETLFTKAQNLVGTSGFNAARLYTSIQSGTSPSEAFQAAINTNTKLLLGLWGSSGNTTITNELAAINAAISQHGSKFTDLVIGISVGSEDLYRASDVGILNKAGIGADPATIASYINTVKTNLSSTTLSGVKIGHVDTWTAWYNTSNSAVVAASDFIGVDAYPYFQNTMENGISVGRDLFDEAIANVKSTTNGKEIWITETGWPVAGPDSNQATANAANAKTFWDQVGCGELFNVTNTFWYTLEDNYGGSLNSAAGPIFGVVNSDGTEAFDLSCSNISKSPASSASVSGTATATNIGSPGISDIPSGVANPSGAVTTTGTASGTASSSMSAITMTNSAGQTITTSVAVNGTGIATGTTMAPTASASPSAPSTGSASGLAASVAGVLGALIAVVAAF